MPYLESYLLVQILLDSLVQGLSASAMVLDLELLQAAHLVLMLSGHSTASLAFMWIGCIRNAALAKHRIYAMMSRSWPSSGSTGGGCAGGGGTVLSSLRRWRCCLLTFVAVVSIFESANKIDN